MAQVYELIGGEEGVRRLVDTFYHRMDTDPDVEGVRRMHPEDLTGSRDKLFLFLSGWFGGPPLYMQKHGHPRLRMRHMPFTIGESERDQWMRCMIRAMHDLGYAPDLRQALGQAFYDMADFMRNQESPSPV